MPLSSSDEGFYVNSVHTDDQFMAGAGLGHLTRTSRSSELHLPLMHKKDLSPVISRSMSLDRNSEDRLSPRWSTVGKSQRTIRPSSRCTSPNDALDGCDGDNSHASSNSNTHINTSLVDPFSAPQAVPMKTPAATSMSQAFIVDTSMAKNNLEMATGPHQSFEDACRCCFLEPQVTDEYYDMPPSQQPNRAPDVQKASYLQRANKLARSLHHVAGKGLDNLGSLTRSASEKLYTRSSNFQVSSSTDGAARDRKASTFGRWLGLASAKTLGKHRVSCNDDDDDNEPRAFTGGILSFVGREPTIAKSSSTWSTPRNESLLPIKEGEDERVGEQQGGSKLEALHQKVRRYISSVSKRMHHKRKQQHDGPFVDRSHSTSGNLKINYSTEILNIFLRKQRQKLEQLHGGGGGGGESYRFKILLSDSESGLSSMIATLCYAWIIDNESRKKFKARRWTPLPVMNVSKLRGLSKNQRTPWLFHQASIDIEALLFYDEVVVRNLIATKECKVYTVCKDIFPMDGEEVSSCCTILAKKYFSKVHESSRARCIEMLLVRYHLSQDLLHF